VLSLASGPQTPPQVTRTIGELFLEQARRSSSRTALIGENGAWTFEMLAGRASRLAADLARQGIGRGDIVAIVSPRSPEMVMAMVAVVLAGAAYLPIEPDQPPERIRGMLEDARARLVLAGDGAERLAEIAVPVQRLDLESAALSVAPTPPRPVGPDDPVYVLFTSGSTGRPKGVAVPHRALMNLLQWARGHFPIGENDVVLQRTPLGFDISVVEVWGPLLSGCPMVLAQPDRESDPRYIRDTIRKHGVTLIQMVPSLLTLVLELKALQGCDTLQRVLCAGEALSTELVRRFHAAHDAELVNLYGPTETTIYATVWHCRRGAPDSPIPIGRPISNLSAYVLDRRGEPMPIGVPGELYLGGIGVALGYVNRTDLTGDRFVADPFSRSGDARMYKTGDRARFRPDGNLEYLGRIDDQLKLHGIRLEPGEIESLLNARPDVLESAIGVTRTRTGLRLTAWVVPAPGANPGAEQLREDLARVLPRSLVPSTVVFLDRLARTASGKIDRRALTLPIAEPVEYDAPCTAMEARVADVWADILGRERIGRHDDLLELGGHSLVAIRIAHDLRSHLKVDITLRTILENPTVASLAGELDRLSAAAGQAPEKAIPRVPRVARVARPAGSPPPAAS
jgi:amino acid adenylation domain-containing protein